MAAHERRFLGSWRATLLGHLEGDVLDVGSGTGINLAHYPPDLTRLTCCEPDDYMRIRFGAKHAEVEIVSDPAESLSFPDHSFDNLVYTLVLCSVDDLSESLAEARRVLRPGGKLVFLEHVRSQNPGLARLQRVINPCWHWLCHCNLTRETDIALARAGFRIAHLQRERMPGTPGFIADVIRGYAVKA